MNFINLIRILLPLLIISGTIVCIRSGVEFSNLPDLAKEPSPILIFYTISLFTFGAKDFGAPIAGTRFARTYVVLLFFCTNGDFGSNGRYSFSHSADLSKIYQDFQTLLSHYGTWKNWKISTRSDSGNEGQGNACNHSG
jgi:hypothetical protein